MDWIKLRKKIERKSGKGVVTEALVGVVVIGIFIFAIVLSAIIPFLFLRIHFVETIVFKYNYDNAQQALLTLVSLTKTDTIDNKIKPASKIVAEYLTMEAEADRPDINFLKEELDKMIEYEIFNCYELSSDIETLAVNKSKCDVSNYSATMMIATPEIKNSLKLVIE